MARDNKNRKGGNKPKKCGSHNQDGNRKKCRGRASKQSKEELALNPAPEPTKITSFKILDDMDKEVKEKLPNNRDDDNGVLLVKFCQKVITACETYKSLTRTAVAATLVAAADAARGDGKDTNMCRTLLSVWGETIILAWVRD